jgi:hypothetical protein
MGRRSLVVCALLSAGVLAGALSACGERGPEGADVPGATIVATRTVVRIAPDGTVTQSVESITEAEEAWRTAARASADENVTLGLGTAAEALSVDGSCTSSDDLFFDEPVGVAANELCISGTGSVDLATLCRGVGCTGNWNGAIQSLTAQATNGHSMTSDGLECSDFAQSATQKNGWTNEILYLGSSCCAPTQIWCGCGGEFPQSACEANCRACALFCGNTPMCSP